MLLKDIRGCFVDHLLLVARHAGLSRCFHYPADILDMKPKSMDELTEVITAATFHPSHCSVFLYSSSRGCIKMGDMRAAALCDQHAKGQRQFQIFV